jgi:uncharacterized protein YjbI with pentapeptide repeats
MDTNEKNEESKVEVKTIKVEGEPHIVGPRMRIYGKCIDEVNFDGADIQQSVFDKCGFDGCSFVGTKARGTDFEGSTLRDVDFTGADLNECYLGGCDLRDAQFRNASLRNANLLGARLHATKGIVHLGIPHYYDVYLVQNDKGVMIQVGCRWLSYPDAVNYWAREGDRKLLSEPLFAYIRGIVRIKGWNLGV